VEGGSRLLALLFVRLTRSVYVFGVCQGNGKGVLGDCAYVVLHGGIAVEDVAHEDGTRYR
jgi:hypothetical protein